MALDFAGLNCEPTPVTVRAKCTSIIILPVCRLTLSILCKWAQIWNGSRLSRAMLYNLFWETAHFYIVKIPWHTTNWIIWHYTDNFLILTLKPVKKFTKLAGHSGWETMIQRITDSSSPSTLQIQQQLVQLVQLVQLALQFPPGLRIVGLHAPMIEWEETAEKLSLVLYDT